MLVNEDLKKLCSISGRVHVLAITLTLLCTPPLAVATEQCVQIFSTPPTARESLKQTNPLMTSFFKDLEPLFVLAAKRKSDVVLKVVKLTPSEQYANSVGTSDAGVLSFNGKPLDTATGWADTPNRKGFQILGASLGGRIVTLREAPSGVVHHSSLLAGENGWFFGEWVVVNGKVKRLSNMSGHYLTPVSHLLAFEAFLKSKNVLADD